jgi:YD repeat-containing protein
MFAIFVPFATARAIALLLFTTPAETISYTYDTQGRLIEASHSGSGSNAGLDVQYRYDLSNNRTAQIVTGSRNKGQQVVVVPTSNGFNVIPVNP